MRSGMVAPYPRQTGSAPRQPGSIVLAPLHQDPITPLPPPPPPNAGNEDEEPLARLQAELADILGFTRQNRPPSDPLPPAPPPLNTGAGKHRDPWCRLSACAVRSRRSPHRDGGRS
jgi:hypothetical protein